MPRARLLKPGYFTNDALNVLPFPARHLFAGLWVIADREGRLEDRPARIRVEVFPYDRVNVSKLLDSLEAAGFILRYAADGKPYIQVVNFLKHQTPNVREAASTIPPPPSMVPSTVQGIALHDPGTPLNGEGEGEGEGEGGVPVAEAEAEAAAAASRPRPRTPAAAAEPTGNEGFDFMLSKFPKSKITVELRHELVELADDFDLEALRLGVASCKDAGILPYPSHMRQRTPVPNRMRY